MAMTEHRTLRKSKDPRFYGEWDLESYEVTTRDGDFRFWLRPNTSDIKAVREVVERRGYDKYKQGPRSGEHWLDIGANIGAFTVLAAARGCTVQGFEPDPVSLAIARLNVQENGLKARCRLFGTALVGDTPNEPLMLSVNGKRGNYWRNSLYHTWAGGFTIPVATTPLDEVLDAWVPGTWHLKMDCEGAEMPLIEQCDISRWGRLYTEWSFDIDPDVNRYRRALKSLHLQYGNVRDGSTKPIPPDVITWPPAWFPAARMIVAWNPDVP